MPARKKKRKKWPYVLLSLAIFTGAIFAVLNHSHVFSRVTFVDSNCVFNPEISAESKQLIQEIITTVAHTGLLKLMGKEDRLTEMGNQVGNQVSDFAYWAYVFSTPQLAQDMKAIQRSSLKYNGFIKGTGGKILREYHANPCFMEQAKGFAKYLGLSEEEVVAILQRCIDNSTNSKKEFKAYMDYLIRNKSN